MIGLIFGRRSGTSTMAKALYERGFPFQEPLDTRYFANQPQGHYESWEARDWNHKIQNVFKLGDNAPGLCPFLFFEPLAAWMQENWTPIIVKAPNISIAWPIWVRTAKMIGRPLVGLWCRRDPGEQVESLVTRYKMEREDAEWCVKMYELTNAAAAECMPTQQVGLYDPQRAEIAAEWFISHNFPVGPPRPPLPVEYPKEDSHAGNNGEAETQIHPPEEKGVPGG